MNASPTPGRSTTDDGLPTDDGSSHPDGSPDDGALADDDVFHLLQNRRRRLALRYLREHGGPVEMRDLAEQVAAWEHDTTVQGLSSKARQRVYIPLYQTHLPKLDEAGVIEYEQARGVVEPAGRVHELYPYLPAREGSEHEADGCRVAGASGGDGVERARGVSSTAGRRTDDSAVFFGGASLFGAGLVAATWAGLVALPGLVVATAVTGLFTVLTLAVGHGA